MEKKNSVLGTSDAGVRVPGKQGARYDIHGVAVPDVSREEAKVYAVGDIDSDKPGTCARANAGKVDFTIVPMHLLAGCARVFQLGAMGEYRAWNWAKCGKHSVAFGCLLRHIFAWYYLGEDKDPKTGESHLDHAFCNLFMLKHGEVNKRQADIDDRPGKMPATLFNTPETIQETKKGIAVDDPT